MTFIDTGYLTARVTPRDILNARAKLWSKVLTQRLVVTEYVIWEMFNALSAPSERSRAHVMFEHLEGNPICEIVPASDRLFQTGIDLHSQRPDKEWSLTDCISFIVMTERGIREALTHDNHFQQAGFVALLRNDPP